MHRVSLACLVALVSFASAPARAITLEQAMADPDWIGPHVERTYWSVDERSLYYPIKRKGSPVRDLQQHSPHARPITDIALSWGFGNPSHFSRVFRDHTGMSPSEFRSS